MRRLWVAIFLMGTLLSPLSTRADGEQVVLFDYVRAEAYTEIKSGNCKASKLTIDAIEESYLDGPTGKVTLHRGIYVWVYNTCNGGNIELYAQKKFYEEDFWHTSHLRSTNLLVDKVKVCEHGQCMFVSLDLRLKADKKSPLLGSTDTIDIGDISVSNFAVQNAIPSGYVVVDGRKDEIKKSGVSFITTHHDIVYH